MHVSWNIITLPMLLLHMRYCVIAVFYALSQIDLEKVYLKPSLSLETFNLVIYELLIIIYTF